MSSSYHPQSDGQTENLNKTLEMYLGCFVFDNPKTWYAALPWAQFWYNTSFHHSIHMTPFKAVFGRDPPTVIPYQRDSSDSLSLQESLLTRDALIQHLKATLCKAQNYMKIQADKRRRNFQLAIGDYALVKLQPYRQHSVQLRKNQKLGMRFFGTFLVLQRIGAMAYKLQLPETARIHPVFHISLLKKFHGDCPQQYFPLPLTTTEQGPLLLSLKILQSRVVLRDSKQVLQVLVQWNLGGLADSTWEDVEDLRSAYPEFNLEGKVDFQGEGIVTCQDAGVEKNKAESKFVITEGHVEENRYHTALRRTNRIREETCICGTLRNERIH